MGHSYGAQTPQPHRPHNQICGQSYGAGTQLVGWSYGAGTPQPHRPHNLTYGVKLWVRAPPYLHLWVGSMGQTPPNPCLWVGSMGQGPPQPQYLPISPLMGQIYGSDPSPTQGSDLWVRPPNPHLWGRSMGQPPTCQRWRRRRRCGRCCDGRGAPWPKGSRPEPRWSGARTTRSAARSSLWGSPTASAP